MASKEMTAIAQSNGEFTFSIYKTMTAAKPGENVIFSPLSIQLALAMTYRGAKDKTASQLASALKFSNQSPEKIHQGFAELQSVVEKREAGCSFDMANRHFIQEGLKVLDSFQKDSLKYYKADAKLTDFAKNTEAARTEINKWVANNTNDYITELLRKGTLDSLTRLVLVNAVYFCGKWQNQFDSKDTKIGHFRVSKTRKENVEMMRKEAKFPMFYTEEFFFVGLPYADPNLCMYIVVPHKVDGLDAIERNLSPAKLLELEGQAIEEQIVIKLPRFRMWESSNLIEVLKTLGVEDLFDEKKCDLSEITGDRSLHVSAAVHEAYIKIDEEGTVAAAATSIGIALCSMPIEIVVDKPSLLYIRDKKSGAILFFGRFNKPMDHLAVCPC